MNRSKSEGCDARQGIQVIARSAQILRVMGGCPQGLSLGAIAKAVDLPRSTVQRIVCALQAEYLVESLAPNGGFCLGPALGKLVYQAQTDITSVVRPFLESLTEQFNETSFLASRAGVLTNVMDRVIAERTLRIAFPVGKGAPLYVTAAGKSLLAAMDDESIAELLSEEIESADQRAACEQMLVEDLARIRETGIAVDVDEFEVGISAVGVALQTYMGAFSVGVVMPSARLKDNYEEICRVLLSTKTQIELRVGLGS